MAITISLKPRPDLSTAILLRSPTMQCWSAPCTTSCRLAEVGRHSVCTLHTQHIQSHTFTNRICMSKMQIFSCDLILRAPLLLV